MSNPWDIKVSDDRIANTKPTFIIFCEDEVSEPIYFKFFETEKIKVNPIPKQKNGIKHIINAIDYCIKERIMTNDASSKIAEEGQVWCVFDRDKANNETDIQANIEFDIAVQTAVNKGFKVAWSNDCFELWILLHFEEIEPNLEANAHRVTYYERLTEILKTLENPNSYLTKALAYPSFNYKGSIKNREKFIHIIRNQIIEDTYIAIERAKRLEAFQENTPNKPFHQKAPLTLVHHLVQELLRVGGKDVSLEI